MRHDFSSSGAVGSAKVGAMTIVRHVASGTLLILLTACGSKAGGTAGPDGGGHLPDARAPDAASSDVSSPGDTGAPSDAGADATMTDGGSPTDAAEEGCVVFDGAPYVALTWNEGCTQGATSFVVAWGTMEGGPYPFTADAGDPCDAAQCQGDANDQLFCAYDLRGLDAGGWCIVTEACDSVGCSAPSGQVCVTIPVICP